MSCDPRKVLAIARTNLVRFLRDPFNVFFVFLFPIGLILVLGLSFGGGFTPTIGVTAGQDELARRFVASLETAPGIRVETVSDEALLRDRVERGGFVAGVIVPDDLAARLAAGEDVKVSFLATSSGSGAQYQMTVMAALSEVEESVRAARFVAATTGEGLPEALARVDAATAAVSPIRVEREWVGESVFGADVQPFDLSAPSQLVLFVFLTGLTSASALIQSRKLGVSRRMLGTPTHTATIVLGESLGRYAVALFQGAYIILATWLLFRVDWGNLGAALLLLAVFGLVAAGTAMLIGSVMASDQAATGVSIFLGLTLAALGGAMVPLEVFGPTMRKVAWLVPHSWAVDGYAVLVRHHGGLADVLPQVGVLAAFAVVLFALAAWRFRAKLLQG